MGIRRATGNEAADVARLYLQSSEHHVELDADFYRTPDAETVVYHYTELTSRNSDHAPVVFVADMDGDVVGMVEVNLNTRSADHSMLRPRVMATADIVVAPGHRQRGIGSALMRRAEDWAREQGANGVMLDMLSTNESALEFYRSLGYEIHGVLLLKRRIDS